MTNDRRPKHARFDLTSAIHLQSRYRRAAYSGASEYAGGIAIPAKVLAPTITAGIKNSNPPFARKIENHLLLIFMTITRMASERKVVQLVAAAKHARCDVSNDKTMIEKSFLRAAMFAAALCPRRHFFV